MTREQPIALCFSIDNPSNIEKFQKIISNKGKSFYGAGFNPTKLNDNDFPVSGYINNNHNIIAKCVISKIVSVDEIQNTSEISEYRIDSNDNDKEYQINTYLELSSMEKLSEPFPITRLKKYFSVGHLAGNLRGFAYVYGDYNSNQKIWKLSELTTFIETEMNMQYNYQSVVILSLLKCPNFTASKELLREQIGRYNNFAKDFSEPLREAVVALSKTNNRNIVSELDGDKIRLNLEPLDQNLKNQLIESCFKRIAEWDSDYTLSKNGVREKISDDTRFFLLLPNEKGSLELLTNQYKADGWELRKKREKWGEVKPGDILLVYFAGESVIHTQVLSSVYRVLSISENHALANLEQIKKLSGITLQKVQELRKSDENSDDLSKLYNSVGTQQNVREISKKSYMDILAVDYRLKVSVNDSDFASANSIVKNTMLNNKDQAFTDLASFLKDEQREGYKEKILERVDDVLKSQSNIVEKLKTACSQKIVGDHLFRFRGGEKKSQAKILYNIADESDEVQKEFEEKLNDFFNSKTEMEFANHWDSLVYTIKYIKSKDTIPEFLFLSYLAFLQNPKLHIPFSSKRSDKLFEFFKLDFKKISRNKDGKNWHNYSGLLELANELRLKLADHPQLSLIDIQGYMWVLSSALLKGNLPPPEEPIINDVQKLTMSDFKHYERVLKWKPNLILYGPPGTGKTFIANEIAVNFAGKYSKNKDMSNLARGLKILIDSKLTQLEYSDFKKLAEEYRNQNALTPEETITRDIRNNVESFGDQSFFKYESPKYGLNLPTTYSRAAEMILLSENKPMHSDSITEIALEKNMIEIDGVTPTRTMNQVLSQDVENHGDESIFVRTRPGTYGLRKQIVFEPLVFKVTFHPSFSYEDFIEGFRPSVTANAKSQYVLEKGIFWKVCKHAEETGDAVFLIIDEINRGNIPKIFGELITLIEKDKRKDYSLKLTYSKDDFSVPKNLKIIATMNTADKSLMQMDDALKRRFSLEEILPDTDLLLEHLEEENVPNASQYAQILNRINKKILGEGLDEKNREQNMKLFRDRQIGHSYFWDVKNDEQLQNAIRYDIIPLLQDYFYGDFNLIRRILGEGVDGKDTSIIGEDNRLTTLVNVLEESENLKNKLLKI